MSVAALTMDEQRLNNYNKTNPLSGPASPQSPQQYQQQQQHQHQQQEQHTFNAEQRLLEEIDSLKDEQARLLQQYADSQRREKILTRRLANKEQEFQDYVSQIAEYKAAQAPSALALRSALLDPAVNLLFEKLKKELKATKAKLEETQNELSAWKFTPDSNTGKRLMAKCRLLYQENEELGKMTSSGRLAKLETELAMQKSFSEEVKKSQSELDDFLQELDEDVEGMQSTILFLQQELKTTRERIQLLEKENYQLKNGGILDAAEDIQKDNNEIEQINAQQHHGGLNGGNNMMTSMVAGVCNSDNSNININQEAINSDSYQQQNETKFQTANTIIVGSNNNKLTPIEEEPCVRVSAYTCGSVDVNDDGYYNGNNNNNNMADEHDDGSNLAAGSRALRATSARKRAYDSLEVNEEATSTNVGSGNGNGDDDAGTTPPTPTTQIIPTSHIPMQQHTITQVVAPPVPRILPPKKSKLRMTPPTIQQPDSLMELSREHDSNLAINTLTLTENVVGLTTTTTAATTAAAVTVEETIKDENAGGGTGGAGVPQRIMTRRRSMRTAQQNGA